MGVWSWTSCREPCWPRQGMSWGNLDSILILPVGEVETFYCHVFGSFQCMHVNWLFESLSFHIQRAEYDPESLSSRSRLIDLIVTDMDPTSPISSDENRWYLRTMFGQILAKRVVTLEFSRMMGQARPDSTSKSRDDVLKHTVIRNIQKLSNSLIHQSLLMSKHPKVQNVSKF